MKNDDHYVNLKLCLTAIMLFITVVVVVILVAHGCSDEKKAPAPPPVPAPAGPPAPTPPSTELPADPPVQKCADGSALGSVRNTDCAPPQVGKNTQVCSAVAGETAPTWVTVASSCAAPGPVPPPPPPPPPPPGPPPPPPPPKPACDKVTTFADLQPLLSLNCAGCHVGFDTYDKAATGKAKNGVALIDDMLRRINLDLGNPEHMPAQRPKLSDQDRALWQTWKDDGLLKPTDCQGTSVPPPPPTFRDFQWTEEQISNDIDRVNLADQPLTRYLIAVDQVNFGSGPAAIATARLAASKATNSVSGARDLFPVAAVAPGIWRINLDDLRLNAALWTAVETGSQLQFESFTQRGLALKAITKSRLPWMFVQDFNDTALRNAPVYYLLTHAPNSLAQLLAKLGVNFSGDLANFKAALIGFNGSTLSPAANRLMARFDSNDGAAWLTFDTGPIVSNAQNVFKNPLLVQAGGQANLKFAAGEQLYSLPNGMLGSFLADAAGKRLNQADPNVVHDFTSNPVSPIIKNAVSCFRCHSGGIISATDQVRGAIAAQNIGADDTQRVLALFKLPTTNDRLFAADNARFSDAVKKLGIDPSAPDPISLVSDKFLGDLTAADVGGLLFLRPEELAACINVSQVGRQQVGQLLNGGTVSHDQLVPALPALLQDCRIFQDSLGGG